MFFHTGTMKKRIWLLSAISLIGLVFLIILLWGTIICAERGVIPGIEIPLVGSFIVASIIILWILLFFKQCKRLDEIDREFLGNEAVEADYEPAYFWSDENKKVLERYQTIADRKKIMEVSIQSSKVIAMQQQINPHFLYNTLEAIRSDMMIAGNTKTADTVEALSHYFAYAASNADQITTIYEELENVKDYFSIQKFRFEDRIEMEIIDEIGLTAIRELCIPRLTLQPLVENAILHGLEKSRSIGRIKIALTGNDQELLLHVIDNGIGMSAEELDQLNDRFENPNRQEPAKKRGGIALDNVNSRIRLLFGEAYGLRAFSMKEFGTDINVSLPRVKKETGIL